MPSGATTGPVVVRTSGGKSSAGVTFTVTLPAPVISRLDPNFGTGGRQRHHRGVQFRHQTGSVTFNGTTASTTSWASDEIQTKVPSGSHHRAGGGEDVRWAVERWSLLHRDPSCAGHLPAGSRFGTGGRQRHHRGVQFRDNDLGNRHLQRNHRIATSWDTTRFRSKVPDGSHHGAGGGEDGRWAVERWSHLYRDRPFLRPIISRLEPDSGLVDATSPSRSRARISGHPREPSPSTEPPPPPPVGTAMRFRQGAGGSHHRAGGGDGPMGSRALESPSP